MWQMKHMTTRSSGKEHSLNERLQHLFLLLTLCLNLVAATPYLLKADGVSFRKLSKGGQLEEFGF